MVQMNRYNKISIRFISNSSSKSRNYVTVLTHFCTSITYISSVNLKKRVDMNVSLHKCLFNPWQKCAVPFSLIMGSLICLYAYTSHYQVEDLPQEYLHWQSLRVPHLCVENYPVNLLDSLLISLYEVEDALLFSSLHAYAISLMPWKYVRRRWTSSYLIPSENSKKLK